MPRLAATNRSDARLVISNLVMVSTSLNTECHQGIATDGAFFYAIDSGVIKKFDSAWNLLTSNTSAASDTGINHLGDGQCYDGKLYIAAENYSNETTYSNMRIAIFNTSDLSFIEYKDISAQGVEVSSLCIDSVSNIIYVSNYVTGNLIYKYSLIDFSYIGSITLNKALYRTQGISIYGGFLWIARGLPYLELCKITLSGVIVDRSKFVASGELEGIDFTTGILYALNDQGAGTKFVYGYSPYIASSRTTVIDRKASLEFIGTGQVATALTLPLSGSIFCRVKIRSLFNYNTIWDISGHADKWECWVDAGGSISAETGINLPRIGPIKLESPLRRWISITLTWIESGLAKMYIDGLLIGSVATTSSSSGTTFYWGGGNAGNTKGKLIICDGMIFNSSLSERQVLELHRNNFTSVNPIVHQPLSEGAGTIAYDTSGNGNHGTITSGTFVSDTPTKKRQAVGGNLVYNGDFSFIPPTLIPHTTGNSQWLDGTAAGSSSNKLFGVRQYNYGGTYSVGFDNVEKYNGLNSLKISTLAVNSTIGVAISPDSVFANYIKLAPNTAYIFSVATKTNNISGSATTGLRIRFAQKTAANGTSATNDFSIGTSTTPWTKRSVVVTTESTTRFCLIEAINIGTDGAATSIMDAWVSDISIVPVSATRSAA